MKKAVLHWEKVVFPIMLVMSLCLTGVMKMHAQELGRVSRNAIMHSVQQQMPNRDSGSNTMQVVNSMQRTPRSNGGLDYTTYDWQTNSGAITRTIVWPDGKVNFGYTQSSNVSYTDRGTAIGTYNTVNDQWIPSGGRLENAKTGFGSIARYGQNGIVVAAHTSTQCGVYIINDKDNMTPNSAPAVSYLDPTYDPVWPNVMTSGPNHNIIHVVATAYDHISVPGMENVNQPILYFRSQDGGQTWDKQNFILPYMDANYCVDWGSNVCYWMETTDDNCLALVVNNAWSDGMVLYSYDNGNTWQRKVFYKHPNPFGYFDNMFLYPRWVSCQWDSQHHLHVLYEFNGCTGEPGSGSYYLNLGGVAYWNETMPYNINGITPSAIPGNLTPGQPFVMDTAYLYHDIYASWWLWSDASHEMWPEYVGYLSALTDNGDPEPDPYNVTEFNIEDRGLHGNYNSGVCAMPVLCMVPGTDDMVAVWCAMDENHMDENGNYYYKLFASMSTDGGMTWSTMKHLTKYAQYNGTEFVYPQAVVVGNQLVIACQMDEETGTYVQSDDSEPYDNYYGGMTFNLGDLFNYAPNNNILIVASANPSNGGTVTGGGYYQSGQTCTLTATANTGYTFSNWTKNGTVVSTNTTYSFSVTESASYVANFTPASFGPVVAEFYPDASNPYSPYVKVSWQFGLGTTCSLYRANCDGSGVQLIAENITENQFIDYGWSGLTMGSYKYGVSIVNERGGASEIHWNNSPITSSHHTIDISAFQNPSTNNSNQSEPSRFNNDNGWLYYDDGTFFSSVGAGGSIYWGIMLPASDLIPYAGTSLTKVALMEYQDAGSYTTNIYLGGTTGPGTLVASKNFSCTGTLGWKEVTLDSPITIDGTQNLWITMYQSGISYPATCCNDTGDANGRWVSVDGSSWMDLLEAAPTLNCTWMIRGYVEGNSAITWSNCIEKPSSTYCYITAIANPENCGTVTGSGYYQAGQTCTLTATANSGYTFVNWTVDGVQVSTNATYNFTVTESAVYTANFSENQIGDSDIIGYTTYDWQSNAAAITRTIVWPDGKVNFAYTQATNTSYSDRGTGIGTYDAVNNEWIPSEGRVENEKTGFGSIARYGQNGIVVAAHTSTQCGVYIINDKDNITSYSTPVVSYVDPTYDPTWPNVMTSGPNRNIIHVVATGYSDNNIYYFRSQDGGQTWDKQNIILPFMGTDYCVNWGSNCCYWMETTEDNCLALVVNSAWSDGMVLYSYDDGNTWDRKVFYKHPNPFSTFDNMFLFPRWTSCQWDSQHHLHVLYEFNGRTGEPGSSTFYPGIGGVAYWNETMPYNINGTTQSAIPGNLMPGQPFVMDTAYLYHDIFTSWWLWSDASHEMWPEYVGYLPALTDDGEWENPYTATSFNIENRSQHGSYNQGVCAFPVLCMVPGTDDMVAVWCAMDENHTDVNGNFYYKLFASMSTDGGATWSTMKHLTKNSIYNNTEFIFPQAVVVGNKLVIACQMDGETGSYVMSADSDAYDNYYGGLTFDLSDIFGYIPSNGILITANANPANGGTVTGGGYYQSGQTCTLTATANEGYTFVNWTENGTVVSTNATYSFTVTSNRNLVANFDQVLSDLYVITATANPSEGGVVTIGNVGGETLIFEPFEEYTVGSKIASSAIAAGHDWWTTWNNFPGSSEDGIVAEYNGTKCGHLTYGSDQVLLLGDEENGIYDLEFDILVPQGKNGYFNILHHFAGSNSTWAMQCYLHMTNDGQNSTQAPGHGTIHAGSNSTADVPCVYDAWMHFRLHVDTDTDVAQYYYTAPGESEVLMCEWQWSLDSFGDNVVGRTLSAMDFFPPQNAATSEFYLDNFSFRKTSGESAPVLSITPTSIQRTLGEDDMTVVPVTINNYGNSIGDWTGWIEFGQGGAGSQTVDLYYHSGETNTGIGSSDACTREIGIRLPGNVYAGAAMGMRIVSTQYYISDTYQSANHNYIFRIYGQGQNGQPGQLLAEKTVYSTASGSWITATFDNPVYMTGQTIWATVQLEQAAGEYPLSMDGGDYGYEADGNWISNNGGNFSHCYSSGSFGGAWLITVNCQGQIVPATWASIDKTEGSIMGGQSDVITLSLNSIGLQQGTYNSNLIINTNDENLAQVVIPVTLNVGNGKSANEVSSSEPLTTSDKGFVRMSGTFEAGATCVLTAIANPGYTFTNWTRNGNVVSSTSTYSFTVTEDAAFVANFSENQSSITQTSDLAQGWNWWSTYIEQDGIDGLTMLEESLGANGHQIKSQTDFVTNFGSMWMGMLTSINNEETYMLDNYSACQVVLTGAPAVPSDHPITVSSGWNWIGYPCTNTMSVAEAFSGFTPSNGDQVKSQSDYAMYYGGMWIGQLQNIVPGTGLMYKSNSTTTNTLVYPDGGRITEMTTSPRATHWTNDIHAYPNNMTVMAVVELDGQELDSENYELAAFDASGECRGSVRLMYVEPIDRHVAFLTVSGKDAAELSFRLYDTETGMEYYDAEESLGFVANAIVGDANDLYVIHFRGTTGMDELANRVQVYPNPVNRGEQFSIGMTDNGMKAVRVEIVNALGVETLRATSVQMPATLTAPATAGVYTLRITVEGKGTIVRKLVVK